MSLERAPRALPPTPEVIRHWLALAATREEEIVWARRYREAVTALFTQITALEAAAVPTPEPTAVMVAHPDRCCHPMFGGTTFCGRRPGHNPGHRSMETMRSESERRRSWRRHAA